ncbi:unnamed protein product [Cunninghamella blakesleeana]
MSAYDHVSGGSLKFKGGSSSIKKKKKKSSKDKVKKAIEEATTDKKPEVQQVIEKTEAEIKFEQIKLQRQMERVSKAAQKSHKERVADFNNKLEQLSEHHDIPKVGPG